LDNSERSPQLRRIARAARWTGVRLRLSEALRNLVAALPIPLLTAIVCLAVVKVRRLDWHGSRPYLLVTAVSLLAVVAAVLWALVRRRPKLEGAIALDRFHGLRDRLANALYFASLPPSERTPLMDLAIEDGCAHGQDLAPRKAAPIAFPALAPLPGLLLIALVLMAAFEIRTYRVQAAAPMIDKATLTADDIDYFRESAKAMAEKKHDPELQAVIDKYNQLIDDLANRRLTPQQAFERMEALDRELGKGLEDDKKALQDGLRRMAEELRKSDLSRPVAEALQSNDLDRAQKELRALAKRMRERPASINKAELDRLRAALERASQNQKERLAELEKRREELAAEREQLLKKKREAADGGIDEEQERLLRRKERELERLDRELEQQRSAQRQLDRLDRELSQAAEDLMRDLGLSAQDLEQGAEDLNRMGEQQMTDQEKEELRQRIQEIRELMRQQGQGGRPRMVRLRRFSEGARGQRGQGGQRGQQQQGQEGKEGEDGQRGEHGQGQGQGEEVWVMGPNGERMLVIKRGGGSGTGSQPGSGSEPGGQGQGQGGKDWGTGHDPNLTGKATHPDMGTTDTSAEAIDTGQGPSRAEVIAGAADRGFVGRNYKRVFTEYRTVAESAIDKEQVPAGYRFYVQRYFQLIRPRE
jgi:hypothetical protein